MYIYIHIYIYVHIHTYVYLRGWIRTLDKSSVLQRVAVCSGVCCSVLQCVGRKCTLCVAVCCSVLTWVMVCCSVLQCVGRKCTLSLQHTVTHCITLQRLLYTAVCYSVLAVCCSVLQCVAVCCSVLQCTAVVPDTWTRSCAPTKSPYLRHMKCKSKETYTRQKRPTSMTISTQMTKRPTHMKNEILALQRDLPTWQMRPTNMKNETYTHEKWDLQTWQKRPIWGGYSQ